jgi:hypothetical protein
MVREAGEVDDRVHSREDPREPARPGEVAAANVRRAADRTVDPRDVVTAAEAVHQHRSDEARRAGDQDPARRW